MLLNVVTTGETSQESGDQDSFRHKLKDSANIYERLGSQFFRFTNGKQRNHEPLINLSWS